MFCKSYAGCKTLKDQHFCCILCLKCSEVLHVLYLCFSLLLAVVGTFAP